MAIQRIRPTRANRVQRVAPKKQGVLAAYMPRIDLSAKRYGLTASKLPKEKLFVAAQSLSNIDKLLRKNNIRVAAGMTNSVGTDTGGLAGHAARFISLITADILVNLTAYDHVVVFPMKARTSLFVYPKYTYGTNKGEHRQGELIRDVFKSSRQSSTYVSSTVAKESYEIAVGEDDVVFVLETPNVIKGTVSVQVGALTATQSATGTWTNPATGLTVSQVGDTITVTLDANATAITGVQVTYAYDNEKIPRSMVPVVNVELAKIQLYATFYQIQIVYDIYADFEADNDYGFSIKSELPEQAALEVKAEIDRLVYDKLYVVADQSTAAEKLTLSIDFSDSATTRDFSDIIKYRLGKLCSRFNQVFLSRTKKQGLKNIVFGPAALDILNAVVSADEQGDAFGPYKLGTYNNIGIYIDPELESTTANSKVSVPCIGIAKSKDGKRAPLVLGEYMPLVPTNRLDLPDFTSMQGWATACAVETLNESLVALGEVTLAE